ncbi:hypothetical protein JKP88DRAFT_246309 [Tribonema minus]|uniref:DOMON domain-containing protein n=1 Tax=Tribonema minus TaxID=303371 RepID=A0A836CCZ6_9STRA|nr:hypothetical protein JKP88DRAFT_246309 [Tribonema minus]
MWMSDNDDLPMEDDVDARGTKQFRIADQRSAQLPGTMALHTLLLRQHNIFAASFDTTKLQSMEDTAHNNTAKPGCSVCDPKHDPGAQPSSRSCPVLSCTELRKKDISGALNDDRPQPDAYCAMSFEWTDEEIFQAARSLTTAMFQHITFDYFVPLTLGLPSQITTSVTNYYEEDLDPTMDALAASALMFAYTALGPVDRVLDATWTAGSAWDMSPVGTVCEHEDMVSMLSNGGVDGLLRGMLLADAGEDSSVLLSYNNAKQLPLLAMSTSMALVDLRLPAGAAGAATPGSCLHKPLNATLQAGRDFKLWSYNDARTAWGLDPANSFEEIVAGTASVSSASSVAAAPDATAVAATATTLKNMYHDVNNVDFLVGGLAEKPQGTSQVGPLFKKILLSQLQRIKKADYFYHNHARSSSACTAALRPLTTSGVNNTAYPVDSFHSEGHKIIDGFLAANGQDAGAIEFVQGAYKVAWTVDSSKGTITFTATLTGASDTFYFAIGLGDKMVDADVMFVTYQAKCDSAEKAFSVTDRFSYNNMEPVEDKTNDLVVGDVKYDSPTQALCEPTSFTSTLEQCAMVAAETCRLAFDGVQIATVEFTRNLKTGDTQDKDIDVDADTPVIWSYNMNGVTQHSYQNRVEC